MRISLRLAVSVASMLLVSIPVLCICLFTTLSNNWLKNNITRLYTEADTEMAIQATADIYRMCEILTARDKGFAAAVEEALVKSFMELGAPELTKKTYKRRIVSTEFPNEEKEADIRLLKFGNTVIDCADAENKNAAANTVLDRLKKRFGCDFTVLAKINDEGDFLRVASTYSETSGKNISGTYIPSNAQNLQRSAVIESLLSGTPYYGFITSSTSTISTNYLPIFDRSGMVIGAMFFGFEQASVKDMERYISSVNAALKCNAWAIDESNPENPIVKISHGQSESNLSIKEATSLVRKNAAFEIIEKSRVLKGGKIGTEIYQPPSPDGRKYLLTYTYYRPWKWVIGTLTELDDFNQQASSIADNFSDGMANAPRNILIIALLVGALAFVLSTQPIKRIKFLITVARALAEANPAKAREMVEDFEAKGHSMAEGTGAALLSLKAVSAHLSALAEDISDDAAGLSQITGKISAFARNAESANDDELLQMKNIARTGRTILASSADLKKTTQTSAEEIQKALELNRECQNALDSLMRKYDTLAAASNSVSQKLSIINDNAEKITALISDISDVSVRTNMLSLNASIEAEKAGENGLGFAVVSRRIRALADTTEKASNDINDIVVQMRGSVNSGVMEMDRFSASMRGNSRTTVATAKKLSSTISNIESIGPKFENIADRISELAKIAISITDSIQNLSKDTEKIGADINELSDADKVAELIGMEVGNSNNITRRPKRS